MYSFHRDLQNVPMWWTAPTWPCNSHLSKTSVIGTCFQLRAPWFWISMKTNGSCSCQNRDSVSLWIGWQRPARPPFFPIGAAEPWTKNELVGLENGGKHETLRSLVGKTYFFWILLDWIENWTVWMTGHSTSGGFFFDHYINSWPLPKRSRFLWGKTKPVYCPNVSSR